MNRNKTYTNLADLPSSDYNSELSIFLLHSSRDSVYMHLFRLVRRAMHDHWALVYIFSIVSSVKCDKTDMNTCLNVSFVLSKVKLG